MSVRPDYKVTDIGEIPEHWEIRTLDEIASQFISGGTPSTANPDYWNGNIPWMRSAWINKRVVDGGEKYISEKGLKNSATNIVPSGSVLVATRVCIGNIAVNKIDIAISQDLTGVVIRRERASPEYVYWALKNSANRINSLVQGSTIRGVLREDLRRLHILVPSLPEQQKISSILSTVDDAIQNTDEIIAKTQRLKKGLMQQLLTKGIGHTKLKQAEIGLIPKEWDVVSYSEVTHRITYGFTNPMPHVEDGLYIITAKNIKDGMIDYQSAKRTSKEAFEQLLTDKSRPRRGDVLLTKDGTIGRSAVADQDSICINQSVALLRPRSDKILPEFLHWSLQSPSIQERIRADSSKTTIHHIAITKLACMRFGLPSIPEQKEIVEIVEAAQSRLTNEIAAYDRLLLLKKSLMQVLLTGKVRVKVD